MADDGNYDLSANFTLNQLTSDLSANVTIRNVTQSTGYNPHASTDLSANFTIGQDYADLSANFTLNHQSNDLSANVTIRNILAYFQHAVGAPTGTNFLTPQTLENYVIRQANRDKIATIDVKYSNTGDRFSWVNPTSILQVFAGCNVNNKTKIFGGYVKEPERVGEEIIFHGQGYGEELLRRKITDAFYDIEASDLIKYKLLQQTSNIDTSQFSFIGEETARTSFHTDTYTDESNIESKSNMTLTAGTWELSPDNGGYETSGYIISNDLTTISELNLATEEYFDDVYFAATVSKPGGTNRVIKISNDGGATWQTISSGAWYPLTDHHSSQGTGNHGRSLKYRYEMTGNGSATPTLEDITISVKTKAIKVYDRVAYEDETLFDAIKDVLYDANLEGYVDVNGIYRLDYVKSKTTTDFIPYLRQGYEILQPPIWKKDIKNMVNSLKGIGADLGSLTKAERDQWTEQDATDWTATNCSIIDKRKTDTQEGDYCINILLQGTGWSDTCDDDSIDTTKFETFTGGNGTLTEANGYIRCYDPGATNDEAFFYFHTTDYPLSSDYVISFKYRVDSFGENVCVFVTTPPQHKGASWTWDRIRIDPGGFFELDRPTSADVTLLTGVLLNTEYTFEIRRTGTTTKIYVDGEPKFSGTLDDPTHDNIQFGDMNPGSADVTNLDYDDFVYNADATAGNALSPSFNKNLDLYETLYCWYRQNGSDGFSIRLETDASNYYSRSLTPKKINIDYGLRLPVGSKAAGWSSTGSPDWTDITQIRYLYAAGVNITIVYVDALHFEITPIEASYEDEDSQAISGIFEAKKYINKQINSIEELEDRLKAIVDLRKDLNEPLDLVVYGRRDITTGDLIKIYFPKTGINDVVFRVDEVHYLLGTMTLTRLFCTDVPTIDTVKRLKILDRETKQIT